MKIGNIEINPSVILAPMAGITDMAFRILCKEQGCGLVFTEMISAKAIMYKNPKTDILLQSDEKEGPIGVQLFGSDPKIISEIARKIDCDRISIFDLNMGCPVPKIVNNGEGSALMRKPDLVGKIVKELSKAVDKPVSVKIRKGIDGNNNAVEIAKIAEENGAKMITVHGRTREEYYSGLADLDIIKEVKNSVNIPVIGNGDIYTPQDGKNMFEYTSCDGIMVGRGAQGNPWIFNEIKSFLENNEIIKRPSSKEIIDTILRHGRILIELKGEYIGIREMRKHVSWYTKGMKNSSKIRKDINQIDSLTGLIDLLKSLEFMSIDNEN